MRKFLYLLLCCTFFIISACASSENASTGSSDTGNTTNTITIKGSNTVELNTTSQYTAVLSPENFTTDAVKWTIDNESVGIIDSNGLFTAKNIGTVNIKASAGGVESTPFSIQVIKPNAVPVESVIVLPASPKEVNAGEPAQFYHEITPLNADYTSIAWSVDNTEIANIDKDTGVLTGNTAGTVNVFVTVDNIKSEPYPVKVILPLESISINGVSSLDTFTKSTYTVTTNTEGESVTGVEWSVDNKTLAVIDASTGLLTARNIAGQVTITATINGKNITKLVTIKKDLKVSGHNITAVGGIITLRVRNNKSNNLTWHSDNTNVATVENGVVTGVGIGTANITVSENDQSATITITVKKMPQNGYELIDGEYHVYNIDGFSAWRSSITSTSSPNCYLYSDLDFKNSLQSTIETYKGKFEGNGHILRNYRVSGQEGFIGTLYMGTIANVTFDNINVLSPSFTYRWDDVGIVVSTIQDNSKIENVHVANAQITFNNINNQNINVGIIAGRLNNSIVKNCSATNSTITVTNTADNIGGLIGIVSLDTKISGCFAENLTITTQGTHYADNGIGGIIGKQSDDSSKVILAGCGATNTTVTNTTTGTISGRVGGLIGDSGDQTHASYFYGTVSSTDTYVGLDFGAYVGTDREASANYVKKQGGTVDTIKNQNGTTLVDDNAVTWYDAIENMNMYLIDNGYTDFAYTYDANKGYPVLEFAY